MKDSNLICSITKPEITVIEGVSVCFQIEGFADKGLELCIWTCAIRLGLSLLINNTHKSVFSKYYFLVRVVVDPEANNGNTGHEGEIHLY